MLRTSPIRGARAGFAQSGVVKCFLLGQLTRALFGSSSRSRATPHERLSVATQLAAAQEVAEALGLSVAADPRLQ